MSAVQDNALATLARQMETLHAHAKQFRSEAEALKRHADELDALAFRMSLQVEAATPVAIEGGA